LSAPDLPRFKVSSVTSYHERGRRVATGYFVLGSWDVHRVVASFPVPGGTAGDTFTHRRRELAETRCAELEAWHAKAMADGT
jgi:hypothetical protein